MEKRDRDESNIGSEEENLSQQVEPAAKKKKQITLFYCKKGVKKSSFGRNKNVPFLSDFTSE